MGELSIRKHPTATDTVLFTGIFQVICRRSIARQVIGPVGNARESSEAANFVQ
jgi:hypothetical protein